MGVDSTVVRAHQHAAGARHAPPPHAAAQDVVSAEADAGGGWVERQHNWASAPTGRPWGGPAAA
jgi:hypothetical protein